MPEIHKMLEGLDMAYWLKSSMLLIRKFLKFPKILKCQPAYLTYYINQKVPEIPKMPEIPKNPKIPTFLVQLMNHSESS